MEKFKRFKAMLQRHLDVTVLIVPHNGTRTRRFRPPVIFAGILFYTAGLLVLGFFSGVSIAPNDRTSLSGADISRINSLNEEIMDLTRQIEGLKDSNKKIRNAIFLADSNAFKEKKQKIRGEGSIYLVFKKMVENLKDFQLETSYFIKPAEGFISRGFNPAKGHFGIDIVLKKDNPVYSAGSGYVSFAGFTADDGNMIVINHSNDFVTVYKHCSSLLKRQRDYVAQGEIIALSGNSGESTGPHLHFEIWKKGAAQNPEEYLNNN